MIRTSKKSEAATPTATDTTGIRAIRVTKAIIRMGTGTTSMGRGDVRNPNLASIAPRSQRANLVSATTSV